MIETKFSAGPWLVQRTEHESKVHHWIGLYDLGPVAGISGRRGDRYMLVDGMIDDHDAALIAAAPDLYAALATLRQQHVDLLRSTDRWSADEISGEVSEADAALAKARGKT